MIEVQSYFSKVASKQTADATGPPPWQDYATRDAAVKHIPPAGDDGVATMLARELGFEFARRNGDGQKVSLNTTVVSGRAVDDDPKSTIVFYRSHVGGFGNLLEMLLEKRQPENNRVTVQSDLATVNLVHDETLCKRFSLTYVGCGSHARRPFALYENDDTLDCAYMLHLFKGLALHEHGLDVVGRNRTNVAAVRNIDSRGLWDDIKELAESMSQRWSASTKLGMGVRYIIKNFVKLTAYLDNPRVSWTNNFSERLLRQEKLMQKNALFRKTLEGRFTIDILRTVMQTALAAGLPLEQYLGFVLKADPKVVARAPELFTPHAVAKLKALLTTDDPPATEEAA